MCICLCDYMLAGWGYPKAEEGTESSNPVELELQAVMNCYELSNTGIGNQTLVLWKSKNTSSPSHLSILALMLTSH